MNGGPKGSWTKYTLTIDGKDYQSHQDVYNQSQGRVGHVIHADVVNKPKNGYDNWYCNAIFAEHERAPVRQQPAEPDQATGVAVRAREAAGGVLTELHRNASICRQVAAKVLTEAGVPPGGEVFWQEIGPIARYFATGQTPAGFNPEPQTTLIPDPPGNKFVPQSAIDKVYDDAIEDDSLPF